VTLPLFLTGNTMPFDGLAREVAGTEVLNQVHDFYLAQPPRFIETLLPTAAPSSAAAPTSAATHAWAYIP
jgi:hypothetical protein